MVYFVVIVFLFNISLKGLNEGIWNIIYEHIQHRNFQNEIKNNNLNQFICCLCLLFCRNKNAKERKKSIIKISLQISSSKNVCMLVKFSHLDTSYANKLFHFVCAIFLNKKNLMRSVFSKSHKSFHIIHHH